MPVKDIWTPSSCIRRRAVAHFNNSPNIMSAVGAINNSPEVRAAFDRRIEEFDDALTKLNFQLNRSSHEGGYSYSEHVASLNQLLSGQSLPTLQDISAGVRTKRSGEKNTRPIHTARDVARTYDYVRYFTEDATWSFATQVTDPAQLSTALLIEGYGVYVATSRGDKSSYDERLARIFVLAFEEVLFREYPQSELLEDILEWMITEREDFSSGIKRDLKLLAATPQTVQEQLASLPDESERHKIFRSFRFKLRRAFLEAGVDFEIIGARVKTDESIQQKVKQRVERGNDAPLLNIYGARCVVGEGDKVRAAQIIQEALPTPHITRNGYLTRRDFVRNAPNPHQPDQMMAAYRACHVNVFLPGGQIGEVQLTTRQDDETARIFREDYQRLRRKSM